MTVVEINSVKYGSTGSIAKKIAEKLIENGKEAYLFVPRGRHNGYFSKDRFVRLFGTMFAEDIHIILGRLTGFSGLFSVFSTCSLIAKIKKINPSIIHLHNLHNSFINIPILFSYLQKCNIPVVWTFHDCWSFTGHCPHFSYEGCFKWVNGCSNCIKYKNYPSCFFDDSKFQYKLKKKYFTLLKQLYIVTPSRWLSDLVKKSFFQLNTGFVKTINNGIDLSVFKPISQTYLRDLYGIPNHKYIVLFVAMGWGYKKGLDVVIDLCQRLPKEKYQIVVVGTDNITLPSEILSIKRTQSQNELAMIYSSSNVFVNPTREEVLGLVNIEALACGIPGITFDSGGSPECYDNTCGSVIECDNIVALVKEIIRICECNPYSKDSCVKKSKEFDENEKYAEYLELYERINSTRT